MALTAPAQKTWPTVDQGTYTGIVSKVTVEDHMTVADKFGNTGFLTLIFRWRLVGQTDEDGAPIELIQYVKFVTGSTPYSKGARAGKLPWLTEITRAFGEPDIQPGDDVDESHWAGKRAKLGVLEAFDADGSRRNSINSVSAHTPSPKNGAAAPAAKPAKQAPAPASEDEDEGQIPF